MKINKYKLYSMSEIRKIGINKCSRIFSEGNENLYNLLKYSYDNNLYVLACCSGHKHLFDSPPYISYKFNASVFHKRFINLIEKMIKDKVPAEIVLSNSMQYNEYSKVSFFGNDKIEADELFTYLLTELKKNERIVDKDFYNFILKVMSVKEQVNPRNYLIDTRAIIDTENNKMNCELTLNYQHIMKGLSKQEQETLYNYLFENMKFEVYKATNLSEKVFTFDLNNLEESNKQLDLIIKMFNKFNYNLDKLLNKEEEEIA